MVDPKVTIGNSWKYWGERWETIGFFSMVDMIWGYDMEMMGIAGIATGNIAEM